MNDSKSPSASESSLPATSETTPLSLRIPGEHPYVDLIRTFLTEIEVDLEKAEMENETEIRWSFTSDAGLSVFYRIYRFENEMFLQFEVATCRIDRAVEPQVLRWLAESNSQFPFPFRLGVVQDDLAIVQFRSYCDGITPEHCKLRIETLLPFSLDIQERLKRDFGLLPLNASRPTLAK